MSAQRQSRDRAALLADIEFFVGFNSDEARRVAELCEEVRYTAGSVVVDQGDPGTDCYVVVAGSASVYVNGEYVATVGPGTMIGEMALLDHRPRTATVVADSELTLLRFDSVAFSKMLDEMPKASERVMEILRSRLHPG